MADINCSDIQAELVTQQQAITNSTCEKDILLLADAHFKVSADHCNTVVDTASLPNIDTCSFPPGYIVFNTDLNCPVVSGPNGWYDMNATLIRQDCAYNTALAWGINDESGCGIIPFYTILDNNQLSESTSPVPIKGNIENWCKVSHSTEFGAGITCDNKLYRWGLENYCIADPFQLITTPLNTAEELYSNKTWTDVDTSSRAIMAVGNGCLFVGYFPTYNTNTASSTTIGAIANGDGTIYPTCLVVSPNITNASKVAVGNTHVVVLRTDGTLSTFGKNCTGILGDPTLALDVCISSPVSVAGGFTDWCQISTGPWAAAGVRSNGTLWAWGNGCSKPGVLGNNDSNINYSSPIQVCGGFTDWCQVSMGWVHAAGVRSNGTLWTWGDNSVGQLGDGGYGCTSSPVSVTGGFTDWCYVSVGYGFFEAGYLTPTAKTMAIRTNGSLYAWGNNLEGSLGVGDANNRSSPTIVTGGFTDWCQISAGGWGGIGIRSIQP